MQQFPYLPPAGPPPRTTTEDTPPYNVADGFPPIGYRFLTEAGQHQVLVALAKDLIDTGLDINEAQRKLKEAQAAAQKPGADLNAIGEQAEAYGLAIKAGILRLFMHAGVKVKLPLVIHIDVDTRGSGREPHTS